MTMAVGHREGDVVILDVIRERKPPSSPEDVVAEFAALFKQYRVTNIVGDKWAGEWPIERFQVHGVRYEASARPKSDIYKDLLPRSTPPQVELLDGYALGCAALRFGAAHCGAVGATASIIRPVVLRMTI